MDLRGFSETLRVIKKNRFCIVCYRFTFRYPDLNHKPTGVKPTKVVKGILA